MESVTLNISDISPSDRRALEHVIGCPLQEKQQVVIQIRDREAGVADSQQAISEVPNLPAWCDVYAGLSDEEIAALEKLVLDRANLTRPSQ